MARCKTYREIEAENGNLIPQPLEYKPSSGELDNTDANAAIPVYPYYISSKTVTKQNRYSDKVTRQIEAANPAQFIDQYSNIRLKIFKDTTPKPEYLINLFNETNSFFGAFGTPKQAQASSENHYVITGTRLDNNEDEVLFALPQNIERRNDDGSIRFAKDHFVQSTKLYKYLNQEYLSKLGKNTSELTDIGLNKDHLLQLVQNVKPKAPTLIKQQGNKFSLGDLMIRYGNDYGKVFSNPFIVTDNNIRFIDPKLKGRSIILYSKFPTGENVTDQIIREGVIDKDRFGYIPLNENSSFSSFEEMMDILDSIAPTQMSYAQRRLVLSDNIIKRIIPLFKNGEMENVYATVGTGGTQVDYDQFLSVLRVNRNNSTFIKTFNSIIETFPRGIFISPALVSSNDTVDGVLARIDESGSITSNILYNNLTIENLGNEIISVGSFPLNITESDYAQLFREDSSLLTKVKEVDKKVVTLHNNPLDLTQEVDNSLHQIEGLREVKGDMDNILKHFQTFEGETLPINNADLDNFVASIGHILMGNNSLNITQNLISEIEKSHSNFCL